MRNITMRIGCGWWSMNVLGTQSSRGSEIGCSYLSESFPFELLDALAAWKRGEAYSLDFNGENIGHILHIAPETETESRVVITEVRDYDGGFAFPVDRERANLCITAEDEPGSFSVCWDEDSARKPELPAGTRLLDVLLPTGALITDLVKAIEEAIKEAGGFYEALSTWYCLDDDPEEDAFVSDSAAEFEAALSALR